MQKQRKRHRLVQGLQLSAIAFVMGTSLPALSNSKKVPLSERSKKRQEVVIKVISNGKEIHAQKGVGAEIYKQDFLPERIGAGVVREGEKYLQQMEAWQKKRDARIAARKDKVSGKQSTAHLYQTSELTRIRSAIIKRKENLGKSKIQIETYRKVGSTVSSCYEKASSYAGQACGGGSISVHVAGCSGLRAHSSPCNKDLPNDWKKNATSTSEATKRLGNVSNLIDQERKNLERAQERIELRIKENINKPPLATGDGSSKETNKYFSALSPDAQDAYLEKLTSDDPIISEDAWKKLTREAKQAEAQGKLLTDSTGTPYLIDNPDKFVVPGKNLVTNSRLDSMPTFDLSNELADFEKRPLYQAIAMANKLKSSPISQTSAIQEDNQNRQFTNKNTKSNKQGVDVTSNLDIESPSKAEENPLVPDVSAENDLKQEIIDVALKPNERGSSYLTYDAAIEKEEEEKSSLLNQILDSVDSLTNDERQKLVADYVLDRQLFDNNQQSRELSSTSLAGTNPPLQKSLFERHREVIFRHRTSF